MKHQVGLPAHARLVQQAEDKGLFTPSVSIPTRCENSYWIGDSEV